jgi:hypothetical protein
MKKYSTRKNFFYQQDLCNYLFELEFKSKNQVEETAKSIGEGRARKVNKNTLLHTIIDVKIQFYIYKVNITR